MFIMSSVLTPALTTQTPDPACCGNLSERVLCVVTCSSKSNSSPSYKVSDLDRVLCKHLPVSVCLLCQYVTVSNRFARVFDVASFNDRATPLDAHSRRHAE